MRRAVAVGVLIVLVTVALVGGASATAASLTRVGGVPPAPAGTRVVGSLAPTTRISVTVTLQPPDPVALQSYASAVSTPGSSDYRQFLSVAAFRARFAPADAQIAAVRSVLSSDGLTPSPVSANGLVITLSGTATQLSSAFSTSFDQVELADGRTAYANTSAPAVPSSIASAIQSITGLNSLAAPQPVGLRRQRPADADLGAGEQPNVVSGGPQACAAGRADPTAYTADELASAYGFSGLYGQNDLGAGQTIGLLELEPYTQSDVSAYASCYDVTPSITNISIAGFDESAAQDGEATNDIEDVIGIAPRAPVLVYQAPNTVAGLITVLAKMVSDDRANVMSTSWGLCEPKTSPSFVAAENIELEEAAIQGQSVFAAAGDSGSADCNVVGGTVDPELSVDDPAGQPFITAVGGTQLSALGPPPAETTWNDDDGYAGGGGISRNATMPAYQLDAVPSVNVIGEYSSGVPCSAPAGDYCRQTPDVSASSSIDRGYDFYQDGEWLDWYGTSFAAPLWAAFTALANASPACTGNDIGFVNPLLYDLAGSDYARYFNDVTTGNNDGVGANGGLYPASAGYDMATGLGSPIGTALAQGLCGASLTPTVVTAVHDAATGASWAGTEAAGASAYASASVTGGGAAPSGTLTYNLYGDAACTAPTLSSQAVSLTVGGAAPNSADTPALNPGSYSYRAAYSGDPNYDAVVGPCEAFNVLAPPPTPSTVTSVSPPATNVARPASIPHALIQKLKIAKRTTATITFTATGGRPQAYQCALAKLRGPKQHRRAAAPRPAYRSRCSSPVTYRHLKPGHYEFFVHAKGVSGGYSPATTTRFTIGITDDRRASLLRPARVRRASPADMPPSRRVADEPPPRRRSRPRPRPLARRVP
jgi:subtilase family serine protease